MIQYFQVHDHSNDSATVHDSDCDMQVQDKRQAIWSTELPADMYWWSWRLGLYVLKPIILNAMQQRPSIEAESWSVGQ